MRLGTPLVLALTILSGARTAFTQSIEITSDLAGTQREGPILPGTNPTLYILARTGGPIDGVTGAELWVSGLPATWSAIATRNPASHVALGNPFATVPPLRANIAFPGCVPPDANGVVLLYSVILAPTSVVNDACLIVQVAIPPTNSAYTTPILIGCDPPDPIVWPAPGTRFIMNPVTRQCTVGVGRTTWSGLKALYVE